MIWRRTSSGMRFDEFPEVLDRDRRHFEATPSLGQHEALRQPVDDLAQCADADAVIDALQPELPTDFRPEGSLVRFGTSGAVALLATRKCLARRLHAMRHETVR